MRGLTFAATVAGMFYGAIAGGATSAEAARCPLGQIYRPSASICVSKASAMRAGVYRVRYARASLKHRYKRPARSNVQKAQTASASSMQEVHKIPRAVEAIPSLRCDELCQLAINLHTWAARNRETLQ
jgi:hypothetical protein